MWTPSFNRRIAKDDKRYLDGAIAISLRIELSPGNAPPILLGRGFARMRKGDDGALADYSKDRSPPRQGYAISWHEYAPEPPP